MRRTAALLFVAVLLGPLAPTASRAEGETQITGEVVARLSVTVTPDENGTVDVPSPFAVLPDGQRVAIHVAESGGIFLMRGRRILRHLPLPPGVEHLQDLQASDRLLVAGQRPEFGRETCRLDVYEIANGDPPRRVGSANPHLRCVGEGADHWRVVAEGGIVGVYHPGSGSTVPLWDATDGFLTGTDQMTAQRAGIGFGDGPAWMPNPDGSVSLKERGRTRRVSGPLDGFFLAGQANGDLFLLEPTDVADLPGEQGVLLPPELRVRQWQGETRITEFRLRAASSQVGAERLVVQGRPVQVVGDRIYWIFVGRDYLEIRTTRLPGAAPPAEGAGEEGAAP